VTMPLNAELRTLDVVKPNERNHPPRCRGRRDDDPVHPGLGHEHRRPSACC
jgi:hypothetical protein